MIYKRDIKENMLQWMDRKEILILYGARQVGKTTLLREILKDIPESQLLACDRPAVADILTSLNLSAVKMMFGNNRVVALDEAQNIENIGRLLKLIYDDDDMNFKIIASGSSSFDLAIRISEPLTGRNIKFNLYPLSVNELLSQKDWIWMMENIEQMLIFGSYPEIVDLPATQRILKLEHLASDYLFKDLLDYDTIRNSGVLRKLLKAIALQIGQLVSVNELAGLVGVSAPTVEKYLDLLEKTFVIFSLSSYSSNLRNELKKTRKYYFWDLGIRNALIQNYNSLMNRQDTGSLWENFCVAERIKYNHNHQKIRSSYFWRTYDGAEVDLLEEENGKVTVFEFKWSPKKAGKLPLSLKQNYQVETIHTIHHRNLHELYF